MGIYDKCISNVLSSDVTQVAHVGGDYKAGKEAGDRIHDGVSQDVLIEAVEECESDFVE